MKPVIGVMPLWDEEKKSIWMLPGYMDAVKQAGGIPFMFPLTDDEEDLNRLMDICDGILLTGGHDVSPELYGEEAICGSVETCGKRDTMESAALRRALKDDIPVLGICRGIQFINVFLGGTLYQDLPLQHPSSAEHRQNAPYDVPVHTVDIINGSPLHECLGTETLAVNSYHHQAIRRTADQLTAMAVSPDGLTEAVYMPGHRFLWAVQWHPEFSYLCDENSRRIFSAFVESSGRISE